MIRTGKGLQHKDDYYETPDKLFINIVIDTKLDFGLDFCASNKNTKCDMFFDEKDDALRISLKYHQKNKAIFCNPPRSKNGKFVTKLHNEWKEHNLNIVMLLCWNDLGNKYGEELLLPNILSGKFKVKNLGKVIFNKNGKPSKFPSRLTYFWCWMKAKP